MGQDVTVVAKPSSNRGVLRFEINRSLTGMGHERFASAADIVRDRPVDRLARRLFEHGGIDAVHVASSMITVDLSRGCTGEGLQEVIERLFRFYPDAPGAAGQEAATREVQAEDAPVVEAPLSGDEEELLQAPEAAAATGSSEFDAPPVAPAEAPDPNRPDDPASPGEAADQAPAPGEAEADDAPADAGSSTPEAEGTVREGSVPEGDDDTSAVPPPAEAVAAAGEDAAATVEAGQAEGSADAASARTGAADGSDDVVPAEAEEGEVEAGTADVDDGTDDRATP